MRLFAENGDTTEQVEVLRLKLIASISPQERFERMNRLCAFGSLAMLEGLREKNPTFSEQQLLILLAKNLWGQEFADHISKKLLFDDDNI